MDKNQKALLLVLDGWGHGVVRQADAIALAKTPEISKLYRTYPNAELVTFGEDVGLPEGQMGNSEVGHMNIGAGRVVYQDFTRINIAARDGEMAANPVLKAAIAYAKNEGKAIHLLGLVSDGGVHSHIDHLKKLVDIIETAGHERTYIHAFTDGRDCDPKSGLGFMADLQAFLSNRKARVASIVGRYYAMDRDKRWERVKKAYDLLVNGVGEVAPIKDITAYLSASYKQGVTDEFIAPAVVDLIGGPATIQADDVVLCYNFRTDRCREITEVLSQADFVEYGMTKLPLHYVTMTRYDDKFKGVQVMFEKDEITQTLGEVISAAGRTQVRIAETEKYPHVSFFFSGGREEPFDGERRIMIPSAKVATYDLQPEMSAYGITDAIMADLVANQPDFVCLNYANSDMVGHTGDFEAAVKAAETVSICTGKLLKLALKLGYEAIVIADHGNSDMMLNPDGSPNTAHTTNMVPIIYVGKRAKKKVILAGRLADVAPTILQIMGIKQPTAMTGKSLITNKKRT
jgi:2,3-bisphosphoglycerate-independent phosphoglycerate mutase